MNVRINSLKKSLVGVVPALLTCAFAFPMVVNAWTPTTPQVAVAVTGGAGADAPGVVLTDSSGNIYSTGSFTGTVDFDPGAGTTNLTAVGSQDAYLLKLDSAGGLVWAFNIGSTLNDAGLALAFDSTGNILMSGGFRDTTDFDPGAGTTSLTTVGGEDGFIAKYDSSGSFIWVKQMGGTFDDRVRSMVVDSSNNILSTGYFQTTSDFDPGPGVSNLVSRGSSDDYVWKLNSSGTFVWAKQMGGASIDRANGIATDSAGNIFVSGSFMGTSNFDTGVGTSNLTSLGVQDSFISKLDSSGALVWVRQVGMTSSSSLSNAVAVDSANNVYIGGSFQGVADFDPSASTATLTPVGGIDAYVWKLNSAGNYVWARNVGSTFGDVTNALTVDSASNVYAVGSIQGVADFDPGAGIVTPPYSAGVDAFAWKLDASGNYVWARTAGGIVNDASFSVAVDTTNNAYVAGSFADTVDFDPSGDTANVASAGSTDAFIWKLDVLGFPTTPTTTTTTVVTTTTLAPTTTTVAPSTTVAAQVSVQSNSTSTSTSSTTTTTVAPVSKLSASEMPKSGLSTLTLLMHSLLILAAGALLELRVRRSR